MLSTFLDTFRPRQNGHHFPDDIFKWIFLNENISITIKFILDGQIKKIQYLFRLMACHRPRDKPSSKSMVVSLLTHIGVSWPQRELIISFLLMECDLPKWLPSTHSIFRNFTWWRHEEDVISELLVICAGKIQGTSDFFVKRPEK